MVSPTIFLPGTICGGVYRIEGLRSQSRIAESYLARHQATRKAVVLTASRIAALRARQISPEMFLASAAPLREPSIDGAPRVIDMGVDDDVAWLARKQVDGETPLADLLADKPLGSPTLANLRAVLQADPFVTRTALAISIATEISDTLRQFAERGVVHGSLDPRTTLVLERDASPVVVGVGYWNIFQGDPFLEPAAPLDFRAPELIAGNKPDVQSDIYTLGVIMYWLITGNGPRPEGDQPTLADLYGSRVNHTSALIAQAMKKNRAGRFQNWAAFYDPCVTLREALLTVTQEAATTEDANHEGPPSGLRTPRVTAQPITRPEADDSKPSKPPILSSSEITAAAPSPSSDEMPTGNGNVIDIAEERTRRTAGAVALPIAVSQGSAISKTMAYALVAIGGMTLVAVGVLMRAFLVPTAPALNASPALRPTTTLAVLTIEHDTIEHDATQGRLRVTQAAPPNSIVQTAKDPPTDDWTDACSLWAECRIETKNIYGSSVNR